MSTPTDILNYRLPARLAELHIFIVLSSPLEQHAPNALELKMGAQSCSISNARYLLDVIADGAVVIARNLLQFLGLGLKIKNALPTLDTMNWKSDDIKIVDLGLTALTPSAATSDWPEPQPRVEQLFKLCFETGNKVSAHFTTKSAATQNATISELCEAFDLVIRLVNREVYAALGKPGISF